MKDYEVRFYKEYHDLKRRYLKLYDIVERYKHGRLDFQPKCSIELLSKQLYYMNNYLSILEERAEIEKEDLN